MKLIRDTRVGVRLAVAFGLLVALLMTVVGVGLWGGSSQSAAKNRVVQANDVTRDLLQMKFDTADFNGSETAYALDVARGAPGATDDTVGNRKAFLTDVQTFRDAQTAFGRHRLSSQEGALLDAFRADVDKFMANDAEIIALYRSGSAADAARAGEILVGDQVAVFDDMATKVDGLTDLVQADVTQADRAAADATSTARSLMLGIGLAAVAVAVVLAILITRSITRPLHAAVDVLQAMAAGDLRQRVPSPSKDEIGQLGTAMNHSLDRVAETVDSIVNASTSLSSSSEELSAVSQQLSAASEETAVQAASVSAAAEQVSHNVQSVAAGAEELGASIREIAQNTTEAARVASDAVAVAEATNETVTKLGDSSAEIGEVVGVITAIAEQTNLLALNATIEAARAGGAGAGFAVVANEVKDLARKSARSSEEIARKIGGIQTETQRVVESIATITHIIGQINDIQTVIAASVEEQAATTNEIGRSVSEGAAASTDIARNITGVAQTADDVTRGATETHRAAEDLSSVSNELLTLVRRFQVGTSGPVAPPATASRDSGRSDEPPPARSNGDHVLSGTRSGR
jgi:methyl-accepting chemotaxis protein